MCTSASILPAAEGSGESITGLWAEELAAPVLMFAEKGIDFTIASIKGGEIPFDDTSLNAPYQTPDVEKFLLNDEYMKSVLESVALKDVKPEEYDAIFLPGGHGTVVDFNKSTELATLVGTMWDAGKVVAAVCHGPNGLVNAKSSSGESILKGKKVTGFSNTEEVAVGKENVVPFLLEDKLKELGGTYEKVADWNPHAVRDGQLITGQNPQSSTATAKLIVEALGL